MYWRGMVLWRGDGLTWVGDLSRLPLERRGQLGGPEIVQEISMQPHGGRWIFALDRPVNDNPKFDPMPGGYLQSPRPILNTFRYRVTSRLENREVNLPIDQRQAALAPALNPSPRVRQLVDGWRDGAQNTGEIVERALRFFRDGDFSYSLNPGTYGENAFEEFLFERRTGFCEHYAAAFATLMRVAGVPSRVVLGYHGGELNHVLGKPYVIVRQSDAHAWTEVWIQGRGWQRVDPTEAIAPERISSGLASYLQSRASADLPEGGASNAMLGWREIMRDVRLAWDSLNHQWDLRVLNFNEDEQRTFLALIGLRGEWSEIFLWQGIGVMLVLGTLWLWLRRPGRAPMDEAGRSWTRFCSVLANAGVRREPAEGPLHFGARAAERFTEHRAALLHIADLYARLRYSPAPPPAAELARAVESLPRLS
jgi:transglutaminase-like putative cysteine protease